MINIFKETKQDCCGCNACEQVCPTKCITMEFDEEGFKYPKVDINKCIGCNKCEKVCPVIISVNNKNNENSVKPKTIGGWHKNDEVRKRSSSGGAFTLLAEYVLNNNGIVFGAALNKNLQVKHIGIETIDELDRLRGSKYVQSDTQDTYCKVKENLEMGRMVLFVGTSCQAAGLNSFLNKEYDKLFVCDFICHGVPSPLVFKKYIDYLETKYKDKVIDFKFRNKDMGWRQTGQQMGTAVKFKEKEIKRFMPAYKDSFMNGFLSDIYLRPSCHKCAFKTIPKNYSDFTIADFWGVDSVVSDLNDKKGTSLVIFNTKKGEKLFEKIQDNFYFKECSFDKAIRRNTTLLRATKKSKNREKFFRELSEKNFKVLRIRYMTAFSWAFERGKKFLNK